MNYLRNEVRNHVVPHRKSHTASKTRKGKPISAKVVRNMKLELAVEREIDER